MSGGFEKVKFTPPGYDGISAVLDNRRTETTYALTILARTYSEYETLVALCASGTNGTLEVPHAGDAWVYLNAFIDNKPNWESAGHEDVVGDEQALYKARVEFVCPNPRPTWKSTGELVF